MAASEIHLNGLFANELPALVGRAALDRASESPETLAALLERILDRMAGNLGLSARLLRVALALASSERRRLSLPGALCLLQAPLQVLVLLDEPCILFLQRLIVGPKARALRPQQQVLRAKGSAVVHVGGWDAADPRRVAGTAPGYRIGSTRIAPLPCEASR